MNSRALVINLEFMILSISFPRFEVNEIGRNELVALDGLPGFGRGMTIANFHSAGTKPLEYIVLKRWEMGKIDS